MKSAQLKKKSRSKVQSQVIKMVGKPFLSYEQVYDSLEEHATELANWNKPIYLTVSAEISSQYTISKRPEHVVLSLREDFDITEIEE